MKKLSYLVYILLLLGLSACSTLQSEIINNDIEPLDFDSKPESDEYFQYEIIASDIKLGEAEMAILVEEQVDKTILFTYSDDLQGVITKVSISADQETLEPLRSQAIVKSASRELSVEAVYAEREVTYSSSSEQGKETWTRSRLGVGYEDNQIYQLLRFLPLKEGYEASFLMETSMLPKQQEMAINVVGIDTIKLGNTAYQAYKVELSLEGEPHQTLWYQIEASHKLLQFGSDTTIYRLKTN